MSDMMTPFIRRVMDENLKRKQYGVEALINICAGMAIAAVFVACLVWISRIEW